jgi:hypothetical protein
MRVEYASQFFGSSTNRRMLLLGNVPSRFSHCPVPRFCISFTDIIQTTYKNSVPTSQEGNTMPLCYKTHKGMVRSDMSKPALIFTARVHITKSTVKILAANTHCKYFFFKKLPKLLIFLYSEPLVSEVCTTLRSAHNSRVSLDRFNIRLALLSVAYCPGSARGGHFSKGLAGYNIGNVQQFKVFENELV